MANTEIQAYILVSQFKIRISELEADRDRLIAENESLKAELGIPTYREALNKADPK